ncbi:MAG: RNA polymerase sigma factor [Armatimonadota bacterium]
MHATAASAHDAELVSRSRAGDEDAFRTLFSRHYRYVYALCLGMLSHREDAEDATQEVFVNAFSRLARFRGDCSFRTWLHRIAVNVCIDALRRRTKQQTLQADMPGDVRDTTGDCIAKLQIREALARLPENYRAVIILREVHGFSYAEIAEVLRCSLDDVKNWLYRGRKAFRDCYEL